MWGSSLVNEQEERPWTNGAAANVASMSLGTGIIAAADERWWSEAVYTSLIGLVTRTAEAEIAEIEANLSPAYRAYKVRRLESAAADGVPDSIPHKPPINAPTYCSAAADRRASAAVRATADASSIVAFIDNTAGQAALSKGYGKDPAANVKAFGDLGFATIQQRPTSSAPRHRASKAEPARCGESVRTAGAECAPVPASRSSLLRRRAA
ncbi:unnamed protein product [Symbiodinium necroappetens]|uniref:Uncharacterized protein n=1 Tax=Symbiodinium necroappetens TaxID=1628268 RepID=A0A812NFH8_9DINO|nr:unnamed protein product [Symbiodinium necroappetens]